MKNRNEIKALVLWDWNHINCKFHPGDNVIVSVKNRYGDTRKYKEEGTVIAVSSPNGETIRGGTTFFQRAFTRYYVEFQDKSVLGIHSHHIKKIPKVKFGAWK